MKCVACGFLLRKYGQIHTKDVRVARNNLWSKTRLTRIRHALYPNTSLRRTSPDFSSHAICAFFALFSRVSCQKLLTKPRVCVIIFSASERGSYRSNKILRGIAQLVEQRSPKPRAEGSSPSAPAKLKSPKNGFNKPFFGLFSLLFSLEKLTARGLKMPF